MLITAMVPTRAWDMYHTRTSASLKHYESKMVDTGLPRTKYMLQY